MLGPQRPAAMPMVGSHWCSPMGSRGALVVYLACAWLAVVGIGDARRRAHGADALCHVIRAQRW